MPPAVHNPHPVLNASVPILPEVSALLAHLRQETGATKAALIAALLSLVARTHSTSALVAYIKNVKQNEQYIWE